MCLSRMLGRIQQIIIVQKDGLRLEEVSRIVKHNGIQDFFSIGKPQFPEFVL